jgi:hypothetical protein
MRHDRGLMPAPERHREDAQDRAADGVAEDSMPAYINSVAATLVPCQSRRARVACQTARPNSRTNSQ